MHALPASPTFRDIVEYHGPPQDGRAGAAALRAAGRLLPLDRPLPYRLPDGLLWFEPALSEWQVARRNLQRLAAEGRGAVLVAAERSLAAPGAPEAAEILARGFFFALSLPALLGDLGQGLKTRAAALLAAPGAHLLVSRCRTPAGLSIWQRFDPAACGIDPAGLARLTADNWDLLAAGTRPETVCAVAPRAGLFTRLFGRGATSSSDGPVPAPVGPAADDSLTDAAPGEGA